MTTDANVGKQYCRYCAFCFEADDFRCSNHPKGLQPHWSREDINRPNHCPNFALTDLGDVETGRMYHPRKQRAEGTKYRQIRTDGIQTTMWEYEKETEP